MVREFFVYLFREAIICVVEEKKRTLGRLLSGASSSASAFGDGSNQAALQKGFLPHVRHHRRQTPSAGSVSTPQRADA